MKTILLATLTAITLSASAVDNICYKINKNSIQVGTVEGGVCRLKTQ